MGAVLRGSARSFVDQLVRGRTSTPRTLTQVTKFFDRAERFSQGHIRPAARSQLRSIAGQLEGDEFDTLRGPLLDWRTPCRNKVGEAGLAVSLPARQTRVDAEVRPPRSGQTHGEASMRIQSLAGATWAAPGRTCGSAPATRTAAWPRRWRRVRRRRRPAGGAGRRGR